jgi:hypothetical protein
VEEVKRNFAAKVAWVENISACMTDIIKSNAMAYSILLNYKDKRRKHGNNTVSTADDSLRETKNLLQSLCAKLTSMKQYLSERAAIEEMYAARLEALGNRWINGGKDWASSSSANPVNLERSQSISESNLRSSFIFTSRRSSFSENVNSPVQGQALSRVLEEPECATEEPKSGFFKTVSRANLAIAESVGEFSGALKTSIPAGGHASTTLLILLDHLCTLLRRGLDTLRCDRNPE